MSAVELVKHNLGRLKAKSGLVKAYQGNALRLKRFHDEEFDMALLFGPLYHLQEEGEKLKSLAEAKRVLKTGGILLAAYIMNEFSVITYGFKERHIKESVDTRSVLLALNIADDYFKAKKQGSSLESDIEAKDKEMYDLKHDLISVQIKLENAEKAMDKLKEENKDLQMKIVKLETEIKNKRK